MEFVPRILFEMALFGALGLGFEVVFTAVLDFIQHRKHHLFGFSSLWYFPLYALIPVFFHFTYPFLFSLPWYVRGLLYVVMFHIAEYGSMWVLRKLLGKSPSEDSYYQSKWHIHGLTRLDFAPAFFVAGLIFEQGYRFISEIGA